MLAASERLGYHACASMDVPAHGRTTRTSRGDLMRFSTVKTTPSLVLTPTAVVPSCRAHSSQWSPQLRDLHRSDRARGAAAHFDGFDSILNLKQTSLRTECVDASIVVVLRREHNGDEQAPVLKCRKIRLHTLYLLRNVHDYCSVASRLIGTRPTLSCLTRPGPRFATVAYASMIFHSNATPNA